MKQKIKYLEEKIPDSDQDGNQYEMEQEIKGLKLEIQQALNEKRASEDVVKELREDNERMRLEKAES